jgi:sigma-E factor negative regulatory protein RseC
MVMERATVVAVNGGQTWVETVRQASCGGCGSQSSCGTSALSKLFGNRPLRVEARNPLHAAVGAEVTIAVSQQGVMGGAARLYLLPLLVLFLSLGMVSLLPLQQEWIEVAVALLTTAAVVQWMRSRGWFEGNTVMPEITEIHVQHVDFVK